MKWKNCFNKGNIFVWQGIVTAKDEVLRGYRWVLGDGTSIKCTQDPWLVGKDDFKVDQTRGYDDDSLTVADLFLQDERRWNEIKVRSVFEEEDANLILATRIFENSVSDRLAWTKTIDGKYSVKSGYQLWHDNKVGTGNVVQSGGWSKLWKLDLPHKIKYFYGESVGIISL